MRTLILLRHAKSDYPAGVEDIERPLSPRGERDAVAAARWLGACFPEVDEVVVSPARRARQTWSAVADEVCAQRVREDGRVYADWGARLGDVVADLDPAARTALIVGHNPGIEDLAAQLARGADSSCATRMRRKYPTAGIAIFGLPEAWSGFADADLQMFSVPRGETVD